MNAAAGGSAFHAAAAESGAMTVGAPGEGGGAAGGGAVNAVAGGSSAVKDGPGNDALKGGVAGSDAIKAAAEIGAVQGGVTEDGVVERGAAGGGAVKGVAVGSGGAMKGDAAETEDFRPNVGLLLADGQGRVLFAERSDGLGWQLPQGGVADGETVEQAMYRELGEELGLRPQDVRRVACSSRWFSYRVPDARRALYPRLHSRYAGQRQRWFLLQMLAADDRVRLDMERNAEFSDWRWVSYWYPLSQVVDFKREAYRRMLRELCAAHTRLCRTQQGNGEMREREEMRGQGKGETREREEMREQGAEQEEKPELGGRRNHA